MRKLRNRKVYYIIPVLVVLVLLFLVYLITPRRNSSIVFTSPPNSPYFAITSAYLREDKQFIVNIRAIYDSKIYSPVLGNNPCINNISIVLKYTLGGETFNSIPVTKTADLSRPICYGSSQLSRSIEHEFGFNVPIDTYRYPYDEVSIAYNIVLRGRNGTEETLMPVNVMHAIELTEMEIKDLTTNENGYVHITYARSILYRFLLPVLIFFW